MGHQLHPGILVIQECSGVGLLISVVIWGLTSQDKEFLVCVSKGRLLCSSPGSILEPRMGFQLKNYIFSRILEACGSRSRIAFWY